MDNQKKIYIRLLLLFVIASSLLYLEYFYFPEKVKDKSYQIIEKKEKLEKLKNQNKQIEEIRMNFQEIQDNTKNIFEYVIEYDQIFNFRLEVEKIAKENDVNIEMNIANNEKVPLKYNLSYLTYNLKVSGNFFKVMNFLGYMENLKYYNDVNKIVINSESEKTDIILETVLKVYVRDNKK